jgi:hypothetical protein
MYSNSSNAEVTVPACALRLTGEEETGAIDRKSKRRNEHETPGRRFGRRETFGGAMYTLDGRRIERGKTTRSGATVRVMVDPQSVPALSISVSPGY